MKKWIFIIIGIAVLGGGGYYGYTTFFKEKPAFTMPARTAKVTKGELSVKVSGSGSVSTVNSEEVKAPEQGTLAKVLVKEGDMVKKGQLLAEYEAPDVADQIIQAQNSIKKQELQMEQNKQKYIAAQDDDARKDVAYQIESLKLDLASGQDNLAELQAKQADIVKVYASIDGKVTAADVTAGQTVQPSTVIASIVDYDNLQSVIQVDELDVSKIKLGQEATVTLDALEDTEIQGKVTKIADEGTATNGVSVFDVTLEFKAIDGVKSGMTAQAEIMVEKKENVLMLPIEAVRDLGGNKAVILADQTAAGGTASGKAAAGGTGSGQTNDQSQGQTSGGPSTNTNRQARTGTTAGGTGIQAQQSAGQSAAQTRSQGRAGRFGNMKKVTVGIHNDSYIEIVSGLEEGQEVTLPAVVSSTTTAAIKAAFGSGGFGAGGFAGGGNFRQSSGGGQAARRAN